MPKFTQLEKGTFVREGKEYDYIVEIAEDFPKRKEGNVRLRIIEERPAIHRVRTRYDPEITMYGDKNASMDLVLGYNPKEMKGLLGRLIFTLLGPFFILLIYFAATLPQRVPPEVIPGWTAWLLILLVPMVVYATYKFLKGYFSLNIDALAEYLKGREVKKMLKKEGFKQE